MTDDPRVLLEPLSVGCLTGRADLLDLSLCFGQWTPCEEQTRLSLNIGCIRQASCKAQRRDGSEFPVLGWRILYLGCCVCVSSAFSLFVTPSWTTVHGIFQARILEQVAVSYSWESSQLR